VFAYAQLFRLPALFTAFADVLLGYFIAFGSGTPYFCATALAMLRSSSGVGFRPGLGLTDLHVVGLAARDRPQPTTP